MTFAAVAAPAATLNRPMRAASLRQVLMQRLRRLGLAVWQSLEEVGRRRAAAELRRLPRIR